MTLPSESANLIFVKKEEDLEMSKHEHGTMDTKVQEKTFEGFMSVVTKTAIASIIVLVFMALVNS